MTTILATLKSQNATSLHQKQAQKYLSNRTSFKPKDTERFSEKTAAVLVKYCKKLAKLDLSNCSQLSDCGLQKLTEGSFSLRQLVLRCCPKITSTGLEAIGKKFSEMEALDLTGCAEVDDTTLRKIGPAFSKVKELNLSSCGKITDDGVIDFVCHCEGLKSLKLTNCKQITPGLADMLAILQPTLKILHISGQSPFSAEDANPCPIL